jgi:HPr kinase/phosphorylase
MKDIKLGTHLEVRELYGVWGKELEIKIITGEDGLNRKIRSNRVQKPGLRLIEPNIQLEEGKIQILGRTEISYLNKVLPEEQVKISEILSSHDVPCFIISKGLTPYEFLINACNENDMPLFTTELYTGRLISTLNGILEERLAPFVNVHGVLLDIHGLGVLILGKSGIGKSECALDLILGGSKLVADDVVEIRKVGTSKLIGSGPGIIKHLMEIRGVGIINIKDLFGTASVMDRREIDMVIELAHWNLDTDYDRLGLDQKTYTVIEVELPYLVLPVSSGRNMATIIEVAVRNQLLKSTGVYVAEKFQDTLTKRDTKKERS